MIKDNLLNASVERERACHELERNGIDFALLTSPENVTYISGFEVPLHVGPPTAFAGVNPLVLAVLAVKDKRLLLITVDTYANKAAQSVGKPNTFEFASFNHLEQGNPLQSYLDALCSVFREAGIVREARVTLGVEKATLPLVLAEHIAYQFPNMQLVESSPCLDRARLIKTKREISLLREAARILDCAHERLRALASSYSGPVSEIELWRDVEMSMITAAGKRMPVTGELLTGPRISLIAPGGPTERVVQRGDAGLLDISPRVNGYWADSSNVFIFGAEPSPEQRHYFTAAREAFETAVDALKPGVQCCEIDAVLRRTFAGYGFPMAHYGGHQIGVSVNEWPKLVPYDKTVIEAGMVFAIEPGVYEGEGGSCGARVERMVAVTETGAEVLNQFAWGIV